MRPLLEIRGEVKAMYDVGVLFPGLHVWSYYGVPETSHVQFAVLVNQAK